MEDRAARHCRLGVVSITNSHHRPTMHGGHRVYREAALFGRVRSQHPLIRRTVPPVKGSAMTHVSPSPGLSGSLAVRPLEGRAALITGSTSGIGSGIAEVLAAQ